MSGDGRVVVIELYSGVTRLIELPLSLPLAMQAFDRTGRHFARGLVTGNWFWPRLRTPLPTEESKR